MSDSDEITIKTQLLKLCGEMDSLSDDEVLDAIGEIYDYWFLPWGAAI